MSPPSGHLSPPAWNLVLQPQGVGSWWGPTQQEGPTTAGPGSNGSNSPSPRARQELGVDGKAWGGMRDERGREKLCLRDGDNDGKRQQ